MSALRTVLIIAAVAMVIGIAFRVWPVAYESSDDSGDLAVPISDLETRELVFGPDQLIDRSADVSQLEQLNEPTQATPVVREPEIILLGITRRDGVSNAWMRVDRAPARAFTVGESIGDWIVQEIGSVAVELQRDTERRTFHLFGPN